MIDLLRLRISQYRQDRILDELFGKRAKLQAKLRELSIEYADHIPDLFHEFEKLSDDTECSDEFKGALVGIRTSSYAS